VKMDARRQPDQSRKNARPGSEFSRFKYVPPYATSLTFPNRSSRIPRHLIPALIPHDDAISWGGHPFLLFGDCIEKSGGARRCGKLYGVFLARRGHDD